MTEEPQTNNTEKKSAVSRAWGWVKERKGYLAAFAAGAVAGVGATIGIQKFRQNQEEEFIQTVVNDLDDQYLQ